MASSSSGSGWIPMPSFVRTLYSHFPLCYNPSIPPPSTTHSSTTPVLWIIPPQPSTSKVLSTDVECLKWQAYVALRGITDLRVRWDVDPTGGVDGRLPSLWLPPRERHEDLQETTSSRGEVLSARMIPGWADEIQGEHPWSSELEGYIDEQARDESRAWVSLLEGAVHAALVRFHFCVLVIPNSNIIYEREAIISTSASGSHVVVILPTPAYGPTYGHPLSASRTLDGTWHAHSTTRRQCSGRFAADQIPRSYRSAFRATLN